MKVLLVSDFYPPVIGGLERHVENLAHELIKRGHEVRVVTIGDRQLPPVRNGVRVVRCPPFGAGIPGLYKDPARGYHPTFPVPAMVLAIRQQLAEWEPDVVHSHGWSTYSAARALAGRTTRLVTTLHDYGAVCPRRTLFDRAGSICATPGVGCVRCATPVYGVKTLLVEGGRRRSLKLLSRVDAALAVSSAVETAHIEIFGDRVSRVPNFLPTSGPPVDLSPTVPARPTVLFLGALTIEKGARVIYDAWDDPLSRIAQLVMIGRPHPQLVLQPKEGVTVIENASNEMVAQALATSAFVVMPGLWPDPCPTVAFEAMAAGKPVVASAAGGLLDIVEDSATGILVPPGDLRQLRSAIMHLLDSPDARKELGERGRDRWKKHFTAEAVVPKIIAAYIESKRSGAQRS